MRTKADTSTQCFPDHADENMRWHGIERDLSVLVTPYSLAHIVLCRYLGIRFLRTDTQIRVYLPGLPQPWRIAYRHPIDDNQGYLRSVPV
jgi:hypothetical protein